MLRVIQIGIVGDMEALLLLVADDTADSVAVELGIAEEVSETRSLSYT